MAPFDMLSLGAEGVNWLGEKGFYKGGSPLAGGPKMKKDWFLPDARKWYGGVREAASEEARDHFEFGPEGSPARVYGKRGGFMGFGGSVPEPDNAFTRQQEAIQAGSDPWPEIPSIRRPPPVRQPSRHEILGGQDIGEWIPGAGPVRRRHSYDPNIQ